MNRSSRATTILIEKSAFFIDLFDSVKCMCVSDEALTDQPGGLYLVCALAH